jgi:hypothetical protein
MTAEWLLQSAPIGSRCSEDPCCRPHRSGAVLIRFSALYVHASVLPTTDRRLYDTFPHHAQPFLTCRDKIKSP